MTVHIFQYLLLLNASDNDTPKKNATIKATTVITTKNVTILLIDLIFFVLFISIKFDSTKYNFTRDSVEVMSNGVWKKINSVIVGALKLL